MVTGFAFLSRLTQTAPPHTRFVFLGAGIRLGLPSHPASRRRSCLRLGVSTTSSSRGLSPPIDRPCRAYSRRRRSAPPQPAAHAPGVRPWGADPARHGGQARNDRPRSYGQRGLSLCVIMLPRRFRVLGRCAPCGPGRLAIERGWRVEPAELVQRRVDPSGVWEGQVAGSPM